LRSGLQHSGPERKDSGPQHQPPGIPTQVLRSGLSDTRSGKGEARPGNGVARPGNVVIGPGSSWPGHRRRTPGREPGFPGRGARIRNGNRTWTGRESSWPGSEGCSLDLEVSGEVGTGSDQVGKVAAITLKNAPSPRREQAGTVVVPRLDDHRERWLPPRRRQPRRGKRDGGNQGKRSWSMTSKSLFGRLLAREGTQLLWIPAFAGMTSKEG
jgi:hypothetical protein